MSASPSSSGRLRVLAIACAIALGIAACGSSDDGASNDPSSPARTAASTPAPPPDSDEGMSDAGSQGDQEGRVAGIVKGMYRDMAAGDAKGVCSVMSDEAREQIAQQVPGGSTDAPEDRTCEKSMSAFLETVAASGSLQGMLGAEVEDVSIDGRNAAVTVSFGGASGKVALRKQDGDWRFGPGAVGPTS